MSTLTERLAVIIDANSSGAVKAMDKASGSAGKLDKEVAQSSKRLKGEFVAAGVIAGAALYKLTGFLKDSVVAAQESAKIGRITTAVIKSTGGAANITAAQVSNLATAISNKTAVDDEAIQSGENMLLTFTNVRNEVGKGNDIFNQATQTITDMSVALGQDMKASAIQLGKALNDPIKGVTALSKVGVSFTEQQKTQIKTLVDSGKTLEAQKIILGELGREFGGAAAASADPTQKLAMATDNLKEAVGANLIPLVSSLAKGLTSMATAGQALAGNKVLSKLTVDVLAVAGAAYAANKAIKLYKAVQTSELATLVFKNAAAHAADATAITAEGVAAGAAAPEVEALSVAETTSATASAATASKVGLLGGAFARIAGPIAIAAAALHAFTEGTKLAAAAKQHDFAGTTKHFLEGNPLTAIPLAPVGIAKSIFHIGDSHDKNAEATKKDTAAATANVTALKQDAAAAAEAAQKEQALLDARIATFNSAIGYQRSELATTDALKGVRDAAAAAAKATRQHGAGSKAAKSANEDYRKAVLDAKDALLSEAGAAVQSAKDQAEARGKTLSAKSATSIYRGELEKLAGNMAPGSPLRKYLQGLIADLDKAAKPRNETFTITTIGHGPGSNPIAPHAPGQPVHRRARGGPIKGPGSGTSDSIPALLSNGEFVVDARGSNLGDAMHYYGARKFAAGGRVDPYTIAGNVVSGNFGAMFDRLSKTLQAGLSRLSSVISNARSYKSSTQAGLMGYADVSGATDSGVGTVQYTRAKANDLALFAKLYNRLDREGLNPIMLGEFMAAGPAAIPAMRQLAGNTKAIHTENRLQRRIDRTSRHLATTATADQYGQQIASGIDHLPDRFARALAKELRKHGIHIDAGGDATRRRRAG